jgi:hypothetical protein
MKATRTVRGSSSSAYQEVAADVQFAVVFFVEAGGLLDVLVHRVFGDGQAVVLLDPALFFEGGGLQVHPDRLEPRQLFKRLDLFLEERPLASVKMLSMAHSRWLFASGGVKCVLSTPVAVRESKATDWGRFPR